jgi:hypothetical protein
MEEEEEEEEYQLNTNINKNFQGRGIYPAHLKFFRAPGGRVRTLVQDSVKSATREHR